MYRNKISRRSCRPTFSTQFPAFQLFQTAFSWLTERPVSRFAHLLLNDHGPAVAVDVSAGLRGQSDLDCRVSSVTTDHGHALKCAAHIACHAHLAGLRCLALRTADQMRNLVMERDVGLASICSCRLYQFALSVIWNSAVAGEGRKDIGMAEVLRPGFHRLGRQVARHRIVNQHVAKTMRIEIG